MIPIAASVLVAVGLAAAMLTAGCRRKKEPEPPAPAPVESPTAAPVAAVPVPGQPAPPVVTSRESNDAAYIQEMTQTLNDFLADYIRQHKRVPKDINEMISLKLITSVPVLPGGKKWVIDQQTGKISAR